MTGRGRVFASFLTVATVAATLLLAIPVGTQAIPLLTEAVGETAVLWNTPDIAVAIVLVLFLLFGFLRARKKSAPPAGPPPSPPVAPTILPPVGAATVTPGLAPDKKVCPRCHTMVNVIDVTCFFCGYKFAEEAKPPP